MVMSPIWWFDNRITALLLLNLPFFPPLTKDIRFAHSKSHLHKLFLYSRRRLASTWLPEETERRSKSFWTADSCHPVGVTTSAVTKAWSLNALLQAETVTIASWTWPSGMNRRWNCTYVGPLLDFFNHNQQETIDRVMSEAVTNKWEICCSSFTWNGGTQIKFIHRLKWLF